MAYPMLGSVFTKTIWERRRSTAWWIVGMVSLAAVTIAFIPSVRDDTESFESLIESFPPGLLSVFGIEDPASLVTATGLVNSRLYAGIGPVILAVLGISLGASAVAGEEDRGTMNLLLAQPITRTRLILEKMGAAVVLISLVGVALFATLAAANPLVELEFRYWGMASANIALALFSLVFYTLALAIGAITGNRGLTVGVAAGFTAATFFINGLAPLVDAVSWTRLLTPFHWLQDPNPLANGLAVGSTVVFLATAAGLTGLAIWGFNRRDIVG